MLSGRNAGIIMKKPLLTIVIISALTILAFIARAATPPDRPPGVADHDLVMNNGRVYDSITITDAKEITRAPHFDITKYFGKH